MIEIHFTKKNKMRIKFIKNLKVQKRNYMEMNKNQFQEGGKKNTPKKIKSLMIEKIITTKSIYFNKLYQ